MAIKREDKQRLDDMNVMPVAAVNRVIRGACFVFFPLALYPPAALLFLALLLLLAILFTTLVLLAVLRNLLDVLVVAAVHELLAPSVRACCPSRPTHSRPRAPRQDPDYSLAIDELRSGAENGVNNEAGVPYTPINPDVVVPQAVAPVVSHSRLL